MCCTWDRRPNHGARGVRQAACNAAPSPQEAGRRPLQKVARDCEPLAAGAGLQLAPNLQYPAANRRHGCLAWANCEPVPLPSPLCPFLYANPDSVGSGPTASASCRASAVITSWMAWANVFWARSFHGDLQKPRIWGNLLWLSRTMSCHQAM